MAAKLKHPAFLAFLGLLVYLSPNFLIPGHIRCLIHDNLDSNVVWYKMLAESGQMFSSNNAIFPNILGGIPRGFMPSELNFYTVSFCFLSPVVAYNLNIILLHIVAFIGMYLLLSRYVFKGTLPIHTALLSLAFAVLPFWPSGELSVAGQPLIVWSFLNLLNHKGSWKDRIIICLYPFFSLFIFSTLFFIIGLFVLLLINNTRVRKINYAALLALAVMGILSVITVYRMFICQFINHYQTQRAFFESTPLGIKGYLRTSFMLFIKGQYHFNSLQWPILVVASLILFFFIREKGQRKLIGILALGALVCACISNVYALKLLAPLVNKLGELKSIQLRFITMLPLIWFTIVALCIYFVSLRYKKIATLLLVIPAASIILEAGNFNTADFVGSTFAENDFYSTYFSHSADYGYATMSEFYCDSLFTKVKQHIQYKNENSLCLGFNSEIAQFNGINTAAAYYSYLPAEKTELLHDIFLPELNKLGDKSQESALMNSRRFQYYVHDKSANRYTNISLDTNAMHKMNIQYIMTVFPIVNNRSLNFDSVTCITSNTGGYPRQVCIYKFR